jgi:hypothetical protein
VPGYGYGAPDHGPFAVSEHERVPKDNPRCRVAARSSATSSASSAVKLTISGAPPKGPSPSPRGAPGPHPLQHVLELLQHHAPLLDPGDQLVARDYPQLFAATKYAIWSFQKGVSSPHSLVSVLFLPVLVASGRWERDLKGLIERTKEP